MVETLNGSREFERKESREIERKYLPLFPDVLTTRFKDYGLPIEQFYLSHPDEPFSLRLREAVTEDGSTTYEATLKDAGQVTEDGLDRLEVTTSITAATYHFYMNPDATPRVRKFRFEPNKYVAIDFFEDGHIQAEAEDPIAWRAFCDQNRLANNFMDITGDNLANNEFRAHMLFRQQHQGAEALRIPDELSPEFIAKSLWDAQRRSRVVTTIAGRSGSGKSTIVREVQRLLQENDVSSVVISTDDYHRGKRWLESYKGNTWTNWDAPIVYDLESLHRDLDELRLGKPIARQHFDFTTEEPVIEGTIEPASVIIVEGIYARDDTFDARTNFRYEVPTPLATCIGRRLLRDQRERPQFADPQKSLRYMLESAEPAYQNQARN